ncbi:MAG: hypothetical protein COY81_04250 [Candidatus Pacebacteria bacterium CG_4_10_14_0_8_um_filter_43_12]|nr:MAG: hypothetical protein COU66_03105 [Candidatus Pacebacteria bacterium CG10_big_fil_rev_8_21_14_0_10_44_11]PIY79097.1 MAG: hypothetical protein COY81_04250 [Candidatus Pacebacteria bacterium CG_4_10_14_0_8_um_filter_43_12]
MTDQPAAPQSSAQSTAQGSAPDPLVSLEELLAKAKANRQQLISTQTLSPGQDELAPPVPMPEEIAAQKQRQAAELQAQRQAELAQKEQLSEADRIQKLQIQEQKLGELKDSPEFQARRQQSDEDQKAAEKQANAQESHVIHQLEETKVDQ